MEPDANTAVSYALLQAGRFFGVGLLSWGLSSHTFILRNCGVGPSDSPEDSARVPPATFISEHMVKVSVKKKKRGGQYGFPGTGK